MSYRVKEWAEFQHYKDRNPLWIKVYKDLLDSRHWHNLKGEDGKHLVSLWLMASEDKTREGNLPSVEDIAFRLRLSDEEVVSLLTRLEHWIEADAPHLLAEPEQPASPEKRREETEREKETEKEERREEDSMSVSDEPDDAEKGNKDSLPYTEVVDYLNAAIGTHYKASTPKTRSQIKARFGEGFTFSDFCAVIDGRVEEWGSDPKMKKYLRPETLFGTKFEGYLNSPSSARFLLQKESERVKLCGNCKERFDCPIVMDHGHCGNHELDESVEEAQRNGTYG